MPATLNRHLIRPLVLLFAGAGTLAFTAGPAAAAVPGLVRISAISANNPVNVKSVTATCPVGKELLGTGFEITGGTGEVVVEDLVPNGGPATAPTAVTVNAVEEDPLGTGWSVTAYGICADPVPGLVQITVNGPFNANNFHGTTASCPAGQTLTGAGYGIAIGVGGEAEVDDFVPNGGVAVAPTSIAVGAFETDPNFAGNWSLSAHAICADPLPGQVRAQLAGPGGSPDFQSATAACPAGKTLTGGGYDLLGANGEALVDDFRPGGGVAAAPTTMTSLAYDADPNFAPNWIQLGYGICADA
jgi:hypothetical protein